MSILFSNFKTILEKKSVPVKKAVFTFGRFNPPTRGHLENIDKVFSLDGDHFIYISSSEDEKDNPLTPNQKLKILSQVRSDFKKDFKIASKDEATPLLVLKKLIDDDYDTIIFVVGEDRVEEFKDLFTEIPKGIKFEIISSGKRHKNVSGTKARTLAIKNDYSSFRDVMGDQFPESLIKKTFNTLRKKLITKEIELRENYISGNIFKIGSIVIEKNINMPETINVDGTERLTRNSEGKLIYPTEEGIVNFWKWFGNSKVVDDKGRPLVVYHGTYIDFDGFDKEKIKSRFDYSFGFHFTDNKKEASIYADSVTNGAEDFNPKSKFVKPVQNGGHVIPVYVLSNNPLIVNSEYTSASVEADLNRYDIIHKLYDAKQSGKAYDGVIIFSKRKTDYDNANYIVFDPNQIKSAIGNNGNFSNSAKITETYYQIIDRGTNYVRVVSESGDLRSFFLDDIEEVFEENILEKFELNKRKNNQITFKGYTTKNFDKTIAESFKHVLGDDNVYAVLSAIKHTDKFLGTGDLTEQYQHYEKSGFFLENLGCIENHNYRDIFENVLAEKIFKDIPIIKEITKSDKIKTANIILAALGIECNGTPEEKIDKAALKIKKEISQDTFEIYGSLLQLASDVGIQWNKDIFKIDMQKKLGLIETHNFEKFFDSISEQISSFDDILGLYEHDELRLIDEDYNTYPLNSSLLVEEAVLSGLKVNVLQKEKPKKLELKKESNGTNIEKRAKRLALKYLKDRRHRNTLHRLTDKERQKLEDILASKGSVITNISKKLCKKISDIEREKLKETVTESYQEEEDSTFENNGNIYSLNIIFDESENLPVEEFSISKLDWVLDYDLVRLDELKKELKRVESSDINIPILVWKDPKQEKSEQWVIVDGIHRLTKAIMKNKKTIKIRKLTNRIMQMALKTKGNKNDI